MDQLIIVEQVSTLTIDEVEFTLVEETGGELLTVGEQGPPGAQGPVQGVPTFVQDAPPTAVGPYVWIQTGLGDGSDFTIWIEDGQ